MSPSRWKVDVIHNILTEAVTNDIQYTARSCSHHCSIDSDRIRQTAPPPPVSTGTCLILGSNHVSRENGRRQRRPLEKSDPF